MARRSAAAFGRLITGDGGAPNHHHQRRRRRRRRREMKNAIGK